MRACAAPKTAAARRPGSRHSSEACMLATEEAMPKGERNEKEGNKDDN